MFEYVSPDACRVRPEDFGKVRDVEMNTRSLVEAKKSADLENQELRKMLKKELEASPRAFSVAQSANCLGDDSRPLAGNNPAGNPTGGRSALIESDRTEMGLQPPPPLPSRHSFTRRWA